MPFCICSAAVCAEPAITVSDAATTRLAIRFVFIAFIPQLKREYKPDVTELLRPCPFHGTAAPNQLHIFRIEMQWFVRHLKEITPVPMRLHHSLGGVAAGALQLMRNLV